MAAPIRPARAETIDAFMRTIPSFLRDIRNQERLAFLRVPSSRTLRISHLFWCPRLCTHASADLVAFYTRRDGVALLKAQNDNRETYEMDIVLKIMIEAVPIRGFVTTGFHDRPPA